MSKHKLTIDIEPVKAGEKHVNLGDFIFQLDAFRKVLSSTESMISGETALIKWKVADLMHSSPAQVALQPSDTHLEHTELIDKTVKSVFHNLKALPSENPPKMSSEELKAYQVFGEKVEKNILRVKVGNHRAGDIIDENQATVVDVSGSIKRAIDAIMSPEVKAIGVVEGRLEYVDIHGSQKLFRIYPAIGPDKIVCSFPSNKIEEARRALNRKTRVWGELTYAAGSNFPKSVKVETIELLPEDDELPNLKDLRGIAPDITGDLSSEEFVRMLRDADDQ